jgi:hypothetical protein
VSEITFRPWKQIRPRGNSEGFSETEAGSACAADVPEVERPQEIANAAQPTSGGERGTRALQTVFVSYSQPDERMGVSIVEHLKRHGLTVWFAAEDLQPGDSFAEIFDQIDRCDAFVVLLSRNSEKSPWVNKELDVAITRQLSARPLLLVPVYLEPLDHLRKVADLKPIDLREGRWEEGIEWLVARLQGHDKNGDQSRQSFEHFLNSLVPVGDAQFSRVLNLSWTGHLKATPASDDAVRAVQAETQARGLQMLTELLDEAGISKEDRARILEAAKRGLELPIVNRRHLTELRRFARRSDEAVVRLAGELWQMRGMQGITLHWLRGWLATYLGRHFSVEDEDLLDWRTENLIDQARAAGLLVRSTESPRGYEKKDGESNPSYDLGPMVSIAGRLVSAFIDERQQVLGGHREG